MEQLRLLLARGLPREDYEHVLICQEASGPLPDLLQAEGWKLHEIGLAPNILSWAWHRKAAEIARAYEPHIVHGAVMEGVALANIIGLRMPGVAVISEETSDPGYRSWRGNLLLRGMCLRSTTVIGVSPRVGDYLRDTAKISASKVRVIVNAVLPQPQVGPEKLSALRSAIGLSPEDQVIGTVGRLHDDLKRFSDLIRALALLMPQFPRVKLLIVGDGPDRDALGKLAKDFCVSEAVIFAGYQSNARQFYPLMDVFSLASAHEAFGLVLVEAMLAGVPVVATQVGGMPFVLDEGRAGRLVPPGAPQALAHEIGALLENEGQRVSLGAAGRERAEREFSADRYCREIDHLYRSLTP